MVTMRDELATLWTDRATIYEYRKTVDPTTHESVKGLVKVHSDMPCRISFKRLYTTVINQEVASVPQVTKLFLDVDIDVKEGSVIEVNRNGFVEKYRRSGVPARYFSHQEITIEKYEDYA